MSVNGNIDADLSLQLRTMHDEMAASIEAVLDQICKHHERLATLLQMRDVNREALQSLRILLHCLDVDLPEWSDLAEPDIRLRHPLCK